MEEKYNYIALSSKVLAVAVINYTEDNQLFDWAVYIDAVPGMDHENEYVSVAAVGAKQSKYIAIALFPRYDINKYRL